MADKTFKTGILITGDASGAQRALKLTQEQVEQLTRATERSREQSFRLAEGWKSQLGSIAGAAAKWSAAMAAAGVGATAALVKSAIDSADATNILAGKLGITTEALSKLEYAAKLSDVSQGALEGGLKRLTKTLADAQDPASKAASALASIGLSAEQLLALPADEQLGAIADALGRVGNQSERAALAQRLFGRAGVDLLPLLAEGSQGIRALGTELEQLGAVVDSDFAARASAFKDNLDRLGTAARGLGFTIADELLVPMSSLTSELIELAKQKELAEGIATFISGIGTASLATAKIIATTANVFRYLGEELAATVNGIAVGDLPRLQERLEVVQGALREQERLGFGAMGPAVEMRAEVSRLQELIRVSDELAASQQRVAVAAEAARQSRPAQGQIEEIDLRTLPRRRQLNDELARSAEAASKRLADRDKAEAEQNARLIESLRQKQIALRMTERDQARFAAQMQLGATATAEQRLEVDALVQQLEDARAAAAPGAEPGPAGPTEDRTSWVQGAQSVLADYSTYVDDIFGRTQEVVSNAFQGMEDALVRFVTTGKLSFADLVDSILQDLARLMIQRAIIAPIADTLSGFLPSFGMSGGGGDTTLGGYTGGDMLGNAKGNVFETPSLHRYVNQVHDTPQFFQFARGGVFAEAGPEAIMPLARDSSGRLGVQASGAGGGVSVEVHNYSGAQAQTRESTDSRGNRRIEVIVGEMIAGEMTRPGSAVNYATRTSFGLRPQMIMR